MAHMNARLALMHPNRKRLMAWLDRGPLGMSGGADTRTVRADEVVTAHVEHCERCADRLEQLSSVGADDEGLDGSIGLALREVYQPPSGISVRVLRAIDERKRADEELDLFLGLFSIVTDAAGLMLPDTRLPESNNSDEHRRHGEDEA
jgi:hypothetical protein